MWESKRQKNGEIAMQQKYQELKHNNNINKITEEKWKREMKIKSSKININETIMLIPLHPMSCMRCALHACHIFNHRTKPTMPTNLLKMKVIHSFNAYLSFSSFWSLSVCTLCSATWVITHTKVNTNTWPIHSNQSHQRGPLNK